MSKKNINGYSLLITKHLPLIAGALAFVTNASGQNTTKLTSDAEFKGGSR